MSKETKFIFNELRDRGFKCVGNNIFKIYGIYVVSFNVNKGTFNPKSIMINLTIGLKIDINYDQMFKKKSHELLISKPSMGNGGFYCRLPLLAKRLPELREFKKTLKLINKNEEMFIKREFEIPNSFYIHQFDLNNAISYLVFLTDDAPFFATFMDVSYNESVQRGYQADSVLSDNDSEDADRCLCNAYINHDLGIFGRAIKLYNMYLSYSLTNIDPLVKKMLALAKKKESIVSLLPINYQKEYIDLKENHKSITFRSKS